MRPRILNANEIYEQMRQAASHGPTLFKKKPVRQYVSRCSCLAFKRTAHRISFAVVPSESTIQGRTSPVSDDSDAYALASVSTPETPSSQRQDPVNQLNAAFQQDLQTAAPQPSQAELDRRAQSDRASHEISAKMLQGWSLLAQECPNPTCHGIPLMKPPKARPEGAPTASVTADPSALAAGLPESGRVRSASKRNKFSQHNHQQGAAAAAAAAAPLSDPRMLCVACGGRYLKESDAPAYDAWAASQEQQQQQTQRGSSSTGQGGAAASVAPSVSHSNKRAQEHIDMGRMKSDNAAAEPAAKRRASVGERAQPSIPAPTMTVPASSNDEVRFYRGRPRVRLQTDQNMYRCALCRILSSMRSRTCQPT